MLYGNSRFKILIILLLVTVGLSIGFAAFSNTLSINESATVTPNPADFNVGLSTTSGSIVSGTVSPTVVSGNASASNITITNSNGVSTISGASVKFEGSTPAVQYTFYVHNSGKYTAYLNSVILNNVQGASSTKVCTPLPGETSSSIASDCSSITYIISVGGTSYMLTTNSNNSNINGHALAAGASEQIILSIIFTKTNPTSDFKFEFGSIQLTYGTAD